MYSPARPQLLLRRDGGVNFRHDSGHIRDTDPIRGGLIMPNGLADSALVARLFTFCGGNTGVAGRQAQRPADPFASEFAKGRIVPHLFAVAD